MTDSYRLGKDDPGKCRILPRLTERQCLEAALRMHRSHRELYLAEYMEAAKVGARERRMTAKDNIDYTAGRIAELREKLAGLESVL